MREIVDGIVMWSWLSEPHGYNFNGYFVRHPGGNRYRPPGSLADGREKPSVIDSTSTP